MITATSLPNPTAFVLSGGAGLGAIQVGMVRALADARIAPDLVVGTSVGSLHGAVIAQHDDLTQAAEQLERLWRGLRKRDVFPGGLLTQAVRG